MKLERANIKRATIYLLISGIIGFAYARLYPLDADTFFISIGKGMMEQLDVSKTWEIVAWDIFANNIGIMYFMTYLGLLHWIFPVGILLFNGLVLGLVVGVAYPILGVVALLVGLLPHGIFELGAFVLATSLGFSVNMKGIRLLRTRSWTDLYLVLWELFWVLMRTVVPLTIVAALIEGFLIGVFV